MDERWNPFDHHCVVGLGEKLINIHVLMWTPLRSYTAKLVGHTAKLHLYNVGDTQYYTMHFWYSHNPAAASRVSERSAP